MKLNPTSRIKTFNNVPYVFKREGNVVTTYQTQDKGFMSISSPKVFETIRAAKEFMNLPKI